jgi:uncharacterized coiled-coil protein SlyX
MGQILDRLEGLEMMVDKQQQTFVSLNENVERLERELAEQKCRLAEGWKVAHVMAAFLKISSALFGANSDCLDEI